MTHTQHAKQAWEVGPVTIRALSSLTLKHCKAVAQAVQSCHPEWTVESGDDYDGYLWLLISRVNEQVDDSSFLISGRLGDIELARIRADKLQTVGRFQTILEMLPALTNHLT